MSQTTGPPPGQFTFEEPTPLVPVGNYRAAFSGVGKTQHKDYGDGWQFKFKILDGPYAGIEISRIVDGRRPPTAKNACGKLLISLVGHEIEPGEVIDWQALCGRHYLISVQATGNGEQTRVEFVMPAN